MPGQYEVPGRSTASSEGGEFPQQEARAVAERRDRFAESLLLFSHEPSSRSAEWKCV